MIQIAPRRLFAASAALIACATLAARAAAGPPMTTANNTVTRSAVDGGGTFSSTANNQLTGVAAEEVSLTTTSTANNVLRSGFDTIAFYPGTLNSLAAVASITTSSATLTWPTPEYIDGTTEPAAQGSAYLIQIASNATLGSLDDLRVITVTVSTSAQTVGKIVGAGVPGLDPNTTYYAQVFLRDNDANVAPPFATAFTTFTTLAPPPKVGALEFLSVQPSSVTVAWIAPFQVGVASQTNQGYILMASSNNFGALAPPGAPVFSSTTFNAQASTLTLSLSALGVPLDLANTYYFQVASLNWIGQSSFTTFTPLNFQVQQSTVLFHLGAMDPNIAVSTVATSSMVVTNVGNWPVTLALSAKMATAGGSPWTLGAVRAVEQPVLMGVFNNSLLGPPPSAFNTLLTASTVTATATVYAGNQTAVQIPAGASRTLWVYFTLPSSSVSIGPETMQVQSSGVYP